MFHWGLAAEWGSSITGQSNPIGVMNYSLSLIDLLLYHLSAE